MAKSLQYCHENNISHNDIKADNFFLFNYDLKSHKFNVKLADFGYANEFTNIKSGNL